MIERADTWRGDGRMTESVMWRQGGSDIDLPRSRLVVLPKTSESRTIIMVI
jgi:hypothetical protein